MTKPTTTRSAPTSAAIASVVSPFCSESTTPSGASRSRSSAAAVAGVVRLHREQHAVEAVRQVGRQHGARRHGELLDRPLDPQAVRVEGGDVVGVGVAQQDVVPVPDQLGGDAAADGAGAEHGDVHGGSMAPLTLQWSGRQAMTRDVYT